jgi:serine/threonine protein kinase
MAVAATYEIPRGTVIGKYEILRKLATGGMAEIYVARVRGTAGFEKLVVLKRILPNVASDPAFVQMFLDEARLAATLQHPNIADVYDVGESNGTYFFTMEFVHGEDARAIRAATRSRNERAPLAIALAVIQGTAAALDYAHEKTGPSGPLGLVHRDVSASNILVSYDGAVKLVDFGIARATSRETKTRTGTLKGKVPYMSPEQCRGHQLDRRTDLFSLGIVLYELTVGRRPFRGETDFQIMEQIVHTDARPPTQFDAAYPKELEAITLKLLARDVRARYQTAEQVLHDLEELVQAQHLWASPKSIGKYMRMLFADKVDAWEAAERDGLTLAQHVQQTITSDSHRSDLVTPPSILQALPPADFPITGPYPTSDSVDVKPASPYSAPMPIAPMPRSRSGLVITAVAALVLAGAAAGYWAMTRDRAEAPAVVTPSPSPSPTPIAAPAPTPTPEPAAVASPSPSPSPSPTVAAEEPPPTDKTVKHPSKKKPPKKPGAKPDDKEKPWDPNSPYLPPN